MTTPSLEDRMARIEGAFEQIWLRLGRIESLIDQMSSQLNGRMDRLDGRVDRLETRINEVGQRLNARMDQLMYWQLGLLAAIAAAILATVLTRLF